MFFSKNNQRVIIIGSSGFIGSHLSKYLIEKKITVKKYHSNNFNLLDIGKIKHFPNLVKRNDCIIFLSAITPKRENDKKSLSKNLLMLKNFIKVIKLKKIKHFIYFSSDAVYGYSKNKITEKSQINPKDSYGIMHLKREKMLINVNSDIITILRPTITYNLDYKNNMIQGPNFIERMFSQKCIKLMNNGSDIRDFISVQDISKITFKIIISEFGGVLNLATGNSFKISHIVKIIKGFYKLDTKIIKDGSAYNSTFRKFNIIKLRSIDRRMIFKSLARNLKLNQPRSV